ncbi:hypothetical protein [Actinomadura kijaniata]|uniref:hypothetical protein n=1 Tax=Actinomadura kijaniata TaxID=46161 RepID=UPI000A511CA8|nr:hypothetical protein [Actinomadura kijaniata]
MTAHERLVRAFTAPDPTVDRLSAEQFDTIATARCQTPAEEVSGGWEIVSGFRGGAERVAVFVRVLGRQAVDLRNVGGSLDSSPTKAPTAFIGSADPARCRCAGHFSWSATTLDAHPPRSLWVVGRKGASVRDDGIWLGENRVCGISVTGFGAAMGLGRLPRGRVSGGDLVRGARARLLRGGMVIAEDLRVGALLREKVVGKRLEARESIGAGRRCMVAIGHGDVREGDHVEVYTPANATGLNPDLVLGYQVQPDRREELGHAEVGELSSDPLAGTVARVALATGRLRPGDRVRVLRGGQPVAETLRLLFMTDEDRRPIGEASAGDRVLLGLGHPGLLPGDMVVAFDVPPPTWTEARTHRLEVQVAHSADDLAMGEVVPSRKSPAGGRILAAGHRARLLRDGTVIADGLTIAHLRRAGTLAAAAFEWTQQTRGWTEVWLDFPDLRKGDQIEPYQVLPTG